MAKALSRDLRERIRAACDPGETGHGWNFESGWAIGPSLQALTPVAAPGADVQKNAKGRNLVA